MLFLSLHKEQHQIMTQRIRYIDVLRGLAMLSIVLFHCQGHEYVWYWLSSFHVPLFFFISGMLFSADKFQSFGSFFKNRFKRLYMPFLVWYILLLLYWLLIEREYRELDIPPLYAVAGIFWGSGAEKWIYPGGPLWFLPALFSLEILYFLVCRIFKSKWQRAACLIVLFIAGAFLAPSPYDLPSGGVSALLAIPFFIVGRIAGNCLKKPIAPLNVFIVMLLSGFLSMWLCTKGHFNLMRLTVDSYLYLLTVPFFGIAALLCLAYLIGKNRVLEAIGKNTIPILAVHAPIIRVVCGAYQYITNTDYVILKLHPLGIISLMCITLIACIPVCFIWKRFLRILF